MLKEKVFVIDYEVVSPISTGAHQLKDSIINGECAEKTITRFPVAGIPFKNGAEINKDLTPLYSNESDLIKRICSYDRKLELLASCYGLAKNRLKPLISKLNPSRTGVILGVGADVTPFEFFETELSQYIITHQNPMAGLFTEMNHNNSRANIVGNPYDIYAIYLANKFNAGAFQKSILTACVSSTQAIGLAYDTIASGEVDVVIAGGTDSIINMLAMISFGKLGIIPSSSSEFSCKPFDINRNGTLAGECAGFTIIASSKFIESNNIKPIAQILGYGNTLDGYKITAPDPSGKSISKAISHALKNSNIEPSMIDYINAHGTGTKHNDDLELKCYQQVFGNSFSGIPISSTKGQHGHAIAAAGIQEFCVLMNCLENDILPANVNLTSPNNEEANLVRETQSKKIKYALTSNFAFGGINTVLAVKNEIL